MVYKIMLDPIVCGRNDQTIYISQEGAEIIWSAYKANFPGQPQTMGQRNNRGGVCWLSEINGWKKSGFLPQDFDYKRFEVAVEDNETTKQ